MNIDRLRAEAARRRALAPTLYGPHGLDTATWPGSIRPPEWMCAKHASSWCRWTDYRPYVPIVLMSIGEPIPYEHKRRTAIAEYREGIVDRCQKWCAPAEAVQSALFEVEEVA